MRNALEIAMGLMPIWIGVILAVAVVMGLRPPPWDRPWPREYGHSRPKPDKQEAAK